MREFNARPTADMWDLEYRLQAVVKQGAAGHLQDPETVPGRTVPRPPRFHHGPGRRRRRGRTGRRRSAGDDRVLYQARTNTKVTIAAERLAVIAAITLPVTAVPSIFGMNVIVNEETRPWAPAVVVSLMAIMSVMLLIRAKRRGLVVSSWAMDP